MNHKQLLNMFGLLLRGFFLLSITSLYSNGVWKFINEYFRNEYKSYLMAEYKRNKHLMPDSEIPTQLPPTTTLAPGPSPDEENPFIGSEPVTFCDLEKELDYHNQPATNDRQRRDDDGFINYWLERKSGANNNLDNNLHCQQEATNCKDNQQ